MEIKAAIIGGAIGIIGALIGAFIGGKYSYKGAIDAVKEQIKYENNLMKQESIDREKKLSRIFATFLRAEIVYNFKAFGKVGEPRDNWMERFKSCSEPFPTFGYDKNHFKFIEFNSLRTEIFSITSDLSKEIIDIYTAFKIFQNTEGILKLTKEQYQFVREVYIKYSEMY